MTDHNTALDLIYLASCAVNQQIPEKQRIEAMDLDQIYSIASRHMISASIAFALESAGFKDQKTGRIIANAIRRTALFDQEWHLIKEEFEKKEIWYMPLKGAILKSYYPKYGMRQFSDHDILFDASRAADVKCIMENMGYTTKEYGRLHHDVYQKPPVLNFEMHTSLFNTRSGMRIYQYYQNISNRIIKKNGYERSFTPEDFYLYLLAHEYKHYANSGTGLRSLLDTYVYLTKSTLDMDYIAVEAGKLGIADFEKANRTLSLHLFGEGTITKPDWEMLDYILSSGTYGNRKNRIQNIINKNNWNKIQYMLYRFSVPISRNNPDYDVFAKTYPFFYKHKVLLPMLPFYRTVRAVKGGRFKTEAKTLKNIK